MNAADQVEVLRDAMRELEEWAKGYPSSVFKPPSREDWKLAAKVLKANGLTLDALSADTIQRVLQGVIRVTGTALSRIENEP